MSNKGDGIGTIFINNKNYKGLKVGESSVKRKYNIPDENGYTVLRIKCSTGSNILNIFNQSTLNVESIEIFNESNININTNTTLPNLNVDNGSTNQYTTWTLPNGNYKVFIKGEFSIKDSTCEILKVKLQNNLTTGYKMFYNCNINSDYEIKIPDSMINTESMFENSNIDRTAKVNLLTTTRCFAMYKNCTDLKKIHINYIEAFNNENVLCPKLSESDCDECFAGCRNIKCGNLNSDTNNKPAIFSWADIPYSWGGLGHFNTLEIEANNTNGLTLTLAEHLFETIDNDNESITTTAETLIRTDWGDGTIDNKLSHTYNKSGTYIVKTRLQPNNLNAENDNKLIKKVINVRNDISSFSAFCHGCINMEQFNIDNTIQPTNMLGMFYGCQSLTSIDMTKFDTTNTLGLGFLFYNCTSLNTIIGLENLKTKNVNNMHYAFARTSITNVDLSKWDCTNIKYIFGLFDYCHKLQSVDLTGWDISKVDSLNSLFEECYELTSIKGIENWDTRNIESMTSTFRELRTLKTLDLSKWNVSKVKFMDKMFDGCNSLETLGDLSNWTTPALVNSNRMFNNTFKMKSLKLTNFDTSNLKQAATNTTYAANMFNGFTSLEEYDIVITFGDNNYIPFDNTSFDSSIKYITIKGTPDVTRMTSFVNILKDQTATGAVLDISQLSSDEIKNNLMANTELINKAKAKGWIFRQYSWDGIENFNTFEIETNDANGLTLTLAQYINSNGTAETLERTDWGDGAIDKELSHTYDKPGTYIVKTKLQPNNINTWDPSDITGGNYNKLNYNKLIKKVINVRNDIDNFVSFCGGCTNMEQFNIDNEIHPTNMAYMFDRCSSLTSIDMTKFDTANTISLYWLFNEVQL